jgi:hypothetical protein
LTLQSQKLLKTSPTRPDIRTDSPKLPSTKAASTASTPVKEESKSTAETLKEKIKQKLKLSSQQQQQTAKKTAAPPLPLGIRQTKRQLSEKDIRIGKNGEIKRRRFRRRNTLPGTGIPVSKLLDIYKNDNSLQNSSRTIYHRSVKVLNF